MKLRGIFQCFRSDHNPQPPQDGCKHLIFNGNNENLIKNGEALLKERISLFDGLTNPIRCFSVGDLKSMNLNSYPTTWCNYASSIYAGVWEGKSVMVKVYPENGLDILLTCREIAVAMQMGTHKNGHRLIGCSLDTNHPVQVYRWAENGTLDDRIFRYKEDSKHPLEWEDRLRIAWEISHAVAYLHTAFRRPIIHRNLNPYSILLDQDCSARLSDFSLCISIPKGETHVDDVVMGTWGYAAPEYVRSGRLTESADVFAFGVILLVLLSGKLAVITQNSGDRLQLVDWVRECHAGNCLDDIVDPAITKSRPAADEHFEHQLKALLELSLRCSSEKEECRPTMVDVATELKSMIMSSSKSI